MDPGFHRATIIKTRSPLEKKTRTLWECASFFDPSARLLRGPGGADFSPAAVDLHVIALNCSAVLDTGAGKADLLTVEFAVDRRDCVAVFDRAGDILKCLFERELALSGFPSALDFGGDDP